MVKIKFTVKKKNTLPRKKLANPFLGCDFMDMIIESNAINLTDNHTIEDIGNGYVKVRPIEKKYFNNEEQ